SRSGTKPPARHAGVGTARLFCTRPAAAPVLAGGVRRSRHAVRQCGPPSWRGKLLQACDPAEHGSEVTSRPARPERGTSTESATRSASGGLGLNPAPIQSRPSERFTVPAPPPCPWHRCPPCSDGPPRAGQTGRRDPDVWYSAQLLLRPRFAGAPE